MVRVLILGGSGKVGQAVRRVWSDLCPPGVDPVFQSRTEADGCDVIWAPGDDPARLPRVDAVVALWGVTRGGPRALRQNSLLGRTAQDLGRWLGADRVLHASSSAVYAPGPCRSEQDRAQPVTEYGWSKRAMEVAVLSDLAPRPCCMRLANVRRADSLVGALRTGCAQLDRFPNGTGPRRSYLSPETLASAIAHLVCCPIDELPDVINVADPGLHDMGDLLRAAGIRIAMRQAPPDAVPVAGVSTARLDRLVLRRSVPGMPWDGPPKPLRWELNG